MANLTLSKQENRVAHLVAQEYLNKEIADMLCISVHTVDTHIKNIRKKFGVSSKIGVAREYMLSLPRCTDVLRKIALCFLVIQIGIIVSDQSFDIRRAKKGRTVRVINARKLV